MDQIEAIRAYVPAVNFTELIPFLLPLIGAILCLVVDAATNKQGSRRFLPIITGATLVLTIVTFFLGLIPNGPFLESAFKADEFALLGCIVILFSALAVTTMGPRQVLQRNLPSGEYYALILFAALGMIMLAISNELLTAFIALEIMSLSLYVMVGIDRRTARASEAAFKYFILGAFASAFVVLGIGFLFGATQTTFLNEMALVFASGGIPATTGELLPLNPMYAFLGFGLLFVGICFKLSLAPFHMWAPDVYEGANTPTTILIATGSKVAAFAFLIHIVASISPWEMFTEPATFIVGMVAVISMVWGNLAAIVQTSIKRMLAYSSVAQTGYMMVAIMVLVALPTSLGTAATEDALFERAELIMNAVNLYLAGYAIMTVVAFGIAFHIGGEGTMAAYRGLFYRRPMAAFGMALVMFSYVGIGFTPPTIGFMGKYYLFKEAVRYDLVGIAVIAVLTSVISAFYYLNLVVTMFMRSPEGEGEKVALVPAGRTPLESPITTAVLVGCCVLIFVLGFAPYLFIQLSDFTYSASTAAVAAVVK